MTQNSVHMRTSLSDFAELQVTPYIVSSPQDVLTFLAQPAAMSCRAAGYPPVWYEWQRDGRMLPTAADQQTEYFVTDGVNSSTLALRFASSAYADVYRCVAKSSVGFAYSQPAQLSLVDSDPKNTVIHRVQQGANITLTCSGVSPYIWYANGSRVSSTPTRELTLTNVSTAEHGLYSCNADQYFLAVQSLPRIVSPQRSAVKTVVHAPLVLRCDADLTVEPTPAVTWAHSSETGGNASVPVQASSRIQLLDRSRVIFIMEARADDGGDYRCSAANSLGTVETVFTVQIISDSDPKNTVIHRVQQGANITLTCSGVSPYIWYANGSRVSSTPTRELTLTNVSTAEHGVYSCNADQYFLAVQSLPRIVSPLSPERSAVETVVHAPLVLRCDADLTVEPTPAVTWAHSSETGGNASVPVQASSRIQLLDRSRVIFIMEARADDGGDYRCSAANSLGTVETVFTVQIISDLAQCLAATSTISHATCHALFAINDGVTSSPTITSDQATTTTAIAAAPTNATAAPTNATAAPTNATAAPTNATAAPTNATAAPTNATAAPTNATAAPTNATAAPTNATAAPTNATAAPTNATAAPTNATAAPTNATAAPTNATAAPTNATAAPATADQATFATVTACPAGAAGITTAVFIPVVVAAFLSGALLTMLALYCRRIVKHRASASSSSFSPRQLAKPLLSGQLSSKQFFTVSGAPSSMSVISEQSAVAHTNDTETAGAGQRHLVKAQCDSGTTMATPIESPLPEVAAGYNESEREFGESDTDLDITWYTRPDRSSSAYANTAATRESLDVVHDDDESAPSKGGDAGANWDSITSETQSSAFTMPPPTWPEVLEE
ncbi:hemicentin-2-like [Sycon ciliatum]|uniref:hemicentin-2-like n=1 Tax=Sycon ciliatum TaxID=27933 RepID=UPI0031F644A6